MKRIIITAIGNDSPGLVNKITSVINQNNGNIETSKMIKINDQFALIIDFSLLENLDFIKSELNNIKKLNIFYQSAEDLNDSDKTSTTYFIKGSDDQGIVDKVSEFFSNKDINITEIETFIEQAPITGSPLFNINWFCNFESLFVKLTLINQNGIIILDNMLWGGNAINPTDDDSKSIRKTGDFIQKDDRVFNILLPIRDGLMVCYKK